MAVGNNKRLERRHTERMNPTRTGAALTCRVSSQQASGERQVLKKSWLALVSLNSVRGEGGQDSTTRSSKVIMVP